MLNQSHFAQEITALSSNGTLSWTNGLVNGSYEVQWSPSLTAGATWTNDWSQLHPFIFPALTDVSVQPQVLVRYQATVFICTASTK